MMGELKDIPKHWQTKKLSDLIGKDGVFCDSDWVETKDQDENGEVRLIQLADIRDGYFSDKSDKHLTLKKAYELNCTFLNRGDILVSRMPEPLGRCCLFPLKGKNKFVTVVDVAIIRSDQNIINNKFLSFAINSPKIRNAINNLKSGTTRKRISRKNLNTIDFPVPPILEQHAIVEKIEELLSDLENGVEQLQTAQQKLKVYRESLLKWAFEGKLTNKDVKDGELPKEWKQTTLGKIISISSGNGLPKLKRHDEGEYLVYGGNGVTGKHSEYMFEEAQLIIGRVGVRCGNAYITKPKSWVTDNAFVVSYDENELSKTFLLYLIKVLNLNKYSVSTAQPVISQGKLYPIEVSIPPFKEQQQIVSELESKLTVCDKLEENINCGLLQAEMLKQSILKNAFEGKLVNNYDTPA